MVRAELRFLDFLLVHPAFASNPLIYWGDGVGAGASALQGHGPTEWSANPTQITVSASSSKESASFKGAHQ
jgi:hypothetical protein